MHERIIFRPRFTLEFWGNEVDSRSGLSRGIGRHRRRRLSIEREREGERQDNDVEEREREIWLYRSAS